MLVAFATNRTRLPAKDREAFGKQGVGLGERSTCDPTYSSVMFRSTGSLPRCSEETKKLIYGAQWEVQPLPAQIRNAIGGYCGEPLIWQESKSVEMWGELPCSAVSAFGARFKHDILTFYFERLGIITFKPLL